MTTPHPSNMAFDSLIIAVLIERDRLERETILALPDKLEMMFNIGETPIEAGRER